METIVLILAIDGFICFLSLIITIIRFARSDKKRYFKFNVVGFDSEKEEFAVKAKDMTSAENIILETLCTKDSDKWFECPIEKIMIQDEE